MKEYIVRGLSLNEIESASNSLSKLKKYQFENNVNEIEYITFKKAGFDLQFNFEKNLYQNNNVVINLETENNFDVYCLSIYFIEKDVNYYLYNKDVEILSDLANKIILEINE